jgi:hypothetical protein
MDPLEYELKFVENKDKYNLGAVTDGSITTAKLADGVGKTITGGTKTTDGTDTVHTFTTSGSLSIA